MYDYDDELNVVCWRLADVSFDFVCRLFLFRKLWKDFPHSLMGRDLSTVRATFNGKPMLLMTSHLESEKQSSEERKAQFNQVRVCASGGGISSSSRRVERGEIYTRDCAL